MGYSSLVSPILREIVSIGKLSLRYTVFLPCIFASAVCSHQYSYANKFEPFQIVAKNVRLRGGAVAVNVQQLNGGLSPHVMTQRSLLGSLWRDRNVIMSDPQIKKIFVLGTMNLISTILLLIWCSTTNSLALTAFTYITIFDIFSLMTCGVGIWVKASTPSKEFSFGYERFEVLAVFSSTLLAQLGALFILKESVERMVQQPDIHEGRLLVGTALAFWIHMLVIYINDNKAFSHVVAASHSSWLQEHMSDISESVCHILPGMSKLLLPRINPFALIGSASAAALVLTYFLVDVQNLHATDTWAAVWIALMTSGTMLPMSIYTGKILIQTTPSHMIAQLDKCIREASTLDGVLEFRNEHFWTLAFGAMAGSVHVRIRRDADEQMVLAHVYNRLSNLFSVLTVQIFKDDWNRPNTFQILGETSPFSKSGTGDPPLLTSSSSGYSSSNSSHYYKPPMVQLASGGNTARPIPTVSGAGVASININKLNPDILSLLGSAKPPPGYSSDTPVLGGTPSKYPTPSESSPVTRTDPDGASRLI